MIVTLTHILSPSQKNHLLAQTLIWHLIYWPIDYLRIHFKNSQSQIHANSAFHEFHNFMVCLNYSKEQRLPLLLNTLNNKFYCHVEKFQKGNYKKLRKISKRKHEKVITQRRKCLASSPHPPSSQLAGGGLALRSRLSATRRVPKSAAFDLIAFIPIPMCIANNGSDLIALHLCVSIKYNTTSGSASGNKTISKKINCLNFKQSNSKQRIRNCTTYIAKKKLKKINNVEETHKLTYSILFGVVFTFLPYWNLVWAIVSNLISIE